MKITTPVNPNGTQFPDAPQIHGLRFRRFAGESDLPAMLAIMNAAWKTDQAERIGTLDELKNDLLPSPRFDPFQDLLIAEVNGEMVAHSQTQWRAELAEPNCLFSSYGFIHPVWRRRGIGRAMLHQNEAHLREIAARLQDKYPRPAWTYHFVSNATNFQPGNQALLKIAGYQPMRQSYIMRRPDLENIPDLPLPAGLEVRPVRPEQYRQVWDASQEAFRDHWGYAEPSEEDYQGWLNWPLFQPDLWQVAWDGNQVAGMVQNFINPVDNSTFGFKRGWTEGISVRRPWRRLGLARALLARSLKMHRDLGMQETALGVDAENPNGALQLYTSMGYQTLRVTTIFRKPLEAQRHQ